MKYGHNRNMRMTNDSVYEKNFINTDTRIIKDIIHYEPICHCGYLVNSLRPNDANMRQ